ncbi:MAG: outer membrane beta-barrel protein [Cyclonatronaceae bacterium]
MINKLKVITVVIAVATLLSGEVMNAQQTVDTKRWTISAYGGMSLATAGKYGGFFGDFDVSSGVRPMFGGSISYDFTPIVTGQFTLFTGKFENENSGEPGYTNNFFGYQVRGIVNTNNLLQTYTISRSLNPYFFVGLGVLNSDIDTDNQPSRSFRAVIFTPGIGTKIYINNWVDFFLQYELNFARSKQLDGFPGDINNRFGGLTAGLNFSIGKRGAKLASWQIQERGVPLTQEDVDRFNRAADRITTVESRVNDQQRRINELDSKIDTRTEALENRINELSGRQDNFAEQIANLEQRVSDTEQRRSRGLDVDDAGMVRNLANGHYVQVFAATSLQTAQNVRNNTIEMMRGVLEVPESMVFIAQRRQFYEVFIGVFNQFPETANALRTAQGTYNDAFVITFPRPVHMRDYYRDVRD